MKSGCSDAFKPDRLGLSCEASKCSDAGTGDLGVLTIHFGSLLVMPAQPAPGECQLKYKQVSVASF